MHLLLLFFAIIIGLFCIYKSNGSRFTPSIIGAKLFISTFIQIIPAIILVYYFELPLRVDSDPYISPNNIKNTFTYSLYCLIIFFALIIIISNLFKISPEIRQPKKFERSLFITIYISSIIIILSKILSSGVPPIYYALIGEHTEAALKKALILKSEIGFGGFAIGYVFQYFPYIAFIYIYATTINKNISKIYSYLYITLLIIFCIYDMQKYKLIYFLIFYFLTSLYYDKFNLKNFLLIISASFLISIYSFTLLHNLGYKEAAESALIRIFIGQMEGFYYILEAITPDINRITNGFPLIALFNFETATDPSADVVRIFFPTADESWINSNTFILANAWSIFGEISVLLTPIILSINILIYIIFRTIYYKIIGEFSNYIYLTLVFNLPINNDFSFFLYLKTIIAFNALAIFTVILIKLSRLR